MVLSRFNRPKDAEGQGTIQIKPLRLGSEGIGTKRQNYSAKRIGSLHAPVIDITRVFGDESATRGMPDHVKVSSQELRNIGREKFRVRSGKKVINNEAAP